MANTRKTNVKPKTGAKSDSEKAMQDVHTDNLVLDESADTGYRVLEDADDETEADVPHTPTAEEIAAVLAYIKLQQTDETLAEVLSSAPTPGEAPTKELFVKVYDVVDTITGTSIRPEDNGALTLSGRVTDADLDAAGVDKAWLLRIGAIVDAGYQPSA